MPVYCFACPECGKKAEVTRPMAEYSLPHPCPVCTCVMRRDLQAELPNAQNDFTHTVYSEALGIHPSQIAEAKKKFPHHNYTDDGRMVISSTGERNRIARDLGFDPG